MPAWLLSPDRIKPGMAVVACVFFLTGCAGSSSPKAEGESLSASAAPVDSAALSNAAVTFVSASTPGNTAYKIGPQDVLDISVFEVPELTRSVQVADNGTINLPLVGIVPTRDRTPQDLERDLTQRLGARYLQSPQVSVFVREYNSQRVTVEGAVKSPGIYPLRGKTSLLQFIAQAGGPNTDTASDTVLVFRQEGGRRSVARFNIDDIRDGKATDPAMQAGDVIVADTSETKAAFSLFLKALPAATLFETF
jgi:polysaccharide export outer membrane protein